MSKMALTDADGRILGPVYPQGWTIDGGKLRTGAGGEAPLPRGGAQLVEVDMPTAHRIWDLAAAKGLGAVALDKNGQIVTAKRKSEPKPSKKVVPIRRKAKK